MVISEGKGGYSFRELCSDINLQESVRAEVFGIYLQINWEQYDDYILGILSRDNAFESYKSLAKELNEDDRQMKILTIYLEAARRCYKNYEEKGIGKDIFIDTMSCLTRFAQEFYQKKGYYGFECPWWAYRQLNMSIFRLGELEFELFSDENGQVISIHIPSNAIFKVENVKESVERCKAFIEEFYPEYNECKYICHTWLLSPTLTPLLNENSNILKFQRMFKLTKVFEEERGYFGFLFQTGEDTPIDELKEDTSLQRKVKALLKKSINIGGAYGELIF